MKKYIYIVLLALLFTGCSPRHQIMDYALDAQNGAISMDSLKMEILNLDGVEMVIMYPDSNFMSIRYDRYKMHHNSIEDIMSKALYSFDIKKTTSLEGK